MREAIFPKSVRTAALCSLLLALLAATPSSLRGQSQTTPPSPPLQKPKPVANLTPGGEATLEADQQRQVGKISYADGHVDVRYENARLRADHVEYDNDAQVIIARGNVQLDYATQHVEADDARYELRTGRGTFHHVHGTFALQRRPMPTLLMSPNPLYFEAEEADRLDETTYRIRKGWLTVCKPGKPVWKFYAPAATVRLKQSVRIENGNFRVYSVPVLYLPYATVPAEERRESGFLIPEIGDTSQKGFVIGDSVYWAPLDWMDMTLGAADFSKRGWSQKGDFRMKPWEGATFDASYYGVIDRGLKVDDEPPVPQGGHEAKLLFTSDLPGGWRAVADLDQLTSLTFRLAWSETFKEAVNSEVRNTAFLNKNFDGFSIGFAALSYQNYLTATPQASITLRTAPEANISSVDQNFLSKLPFYWSFDAFTGGNYRADGITPFSTPGFVSRSEIAPTVTLPLHVGDWINITPSFTFRSTYYGAQLRNGSFLDRGLFRDTEEFSIDLRFPVIERVYDHGETKWKHVVEPYLVYRLVNGVNDFGQFLRFDEDDTLTDTNEIEYGVTQRLYRRTANGESQEFITWHIAQKYFFDPTFGGALVPGERNVFQTLVSLTPFAFADVARRFSPIVSDVTVAPGKRWDTQFIVNYDPQRNRLTAIGTLLKLKPYKESFITLAHFYTLNLPVNPEPPPPNFQQHSNQVRTLFGYGEPNRRGFNVEFGASYDFVAQAFQNQIVEVSYNGSCCGLGFEYRRFSFGTIRNENQYSIVIRIANLGSAGNLRHQEKIF